MTIEKIYHAADRMGITSRTITAEGYMLVPGVLARTGVQEYRAHELGLEKDGMDPMQVLRLLRPAEEVFQAESLSSFENKPVTIEHPEEDVTAANWKQYAVGEVRDVQRCGELMSGLILIKDADAIEAMQAGKVELSNGYTFTLDMTSGQSVDGQPYDAVQRNIRGNHVALVDVARCGSACRIADSDTHLSKPKGSPMDDPERRTVTVDGHVLDVSDSAAAAIDQLIQERDAAVAAKTDAEPARIAVGDKLLNLNEAGQFIGELQAQIEALKRDVMTPEQRDIMVADWAKMLGEAKRLVPSLVTEGKTCLAIRREVIATVAARDTTAKAVANAVLAGQKLEAADAPIVRAAFQAVCAALGAVADDTALQSNDAALAAVLVGHDAEGGAQPKTCGRDSFLARISTSWMAKPAL